MLKQIMWHPGEQRIKIRNDNNDIKFEKYNPISIYRFWTLKLCEMV